MAEEVEEEMMALEAIFYDSFFKLDNNRFRLRIDPNLDNEGEGPPPLFLEILLPDGYPHIIPEFDINNLNNIKFSEPAKKAILEGLHDQASNQAGENMCYNLAEWLKEKLPEFFALKNVSATADHDGDTLDVSIQSDTKNVETIKKEVKEKMTKSQKRRFFDRFGAAGEKPRGWNWVSIISHLSQVPQHGSASVQTEVSDQPILEAYFRHNVEMQVLVGKPSKENYCLIYSGMHINRPKRVLGCCGCAPFSAKFNRFGHSIIVGVQKIWFE